MTSPYDIINIKYLSRDSQGKLIPNPLLKSHITPRHLTPTNWIDLVLELGFKSEGKEYSHKNDPNLCLSFTHEIEQLSIIRKGKELIYFDYVMYSTLPVMIGSLLESIRGLYETQS